MNPPSRDGANGSTVGTTAAGAAVGSWGSAGLGYAGGTGGGAFFGFGCMKPDGAALVGGAAFHCGVC